SRALADVDVRAGADGAVERDRVAEMAHLAGAVRDDSIEPPADAVLLADGQPQVRRKVEPTIVSGRIERPGDLVAGFHFDPVAGAEAQRGRRRRRVGPARVLAAELSPGSPEEPDP